MKKPLFTLLHVSHKNPVNKIRQAKITSVGLISAVLLFALVVFLFIISQRDKLNLLVLKNRHRNNVTNNRALADQMKELHLNLSGLNKKIALLNKKKKFLSKKISMPQAAVDSVDSEPNYSKKEMTAVIAAHVESLTELEEYFKTLLKDITATPKALNRIPTLSPVRDRAVFTSGFGKRIDHFTGKITMHRGFDYSDKIGTPIFSAASGKVFAVGIGEGVEKAFGLVIKINHLNGLRTLYAHLDKVMVKKNEIVKKGQMIGRLGNSGRTFGPHLHYEMFFKGENIDPGLFVLSE